MAALAARFDHGEHNLNLRAIVCTALMALSIAAAAQAAGAKADANFVGNGRVETAGARQFHASICSVKQPGNECAADPGWGERSPPLQRSLMAAVLAGIRNPGSMEHRLTLPAAGPYTLPPADTAYAGAAELLDVAARATQAPAALSAPGVAGFQRNNPASSAASTLEEGGTEPKMYATLFIGLCLLAFTSRTQGTPIFA